MPDEERPEEELPLEENAQDEEEVRAEDPEPSELPELPETSPEAPESPAETLEPLVSSEPLELPKPLEAAPEAPEAPDIAIEPPDLPDEDTAVGFEPTPDLLEKAPPERETEGGPQPGMSLKERYAAWEAAGGEKSGFERPERAAPDYTPEEGFAQQQLEPRDDFDPEKPDDEQRQSDEEFEKKFAETGFAVRREGQQEWEAIEREAWEKEFAAQRETPDSGKEAGSGTGALTSAIAESNGLLRELVTNMNVLVLQAELQSTFLEAIHESMSEREESTSRWS